MTRDRDPALIMGMARIVRLAYEGGDLTALLDALVARVEHDRTDAAALMDLSTLMQVTSQPDRARALQDQALSLRRAYRSTHGRGDQLTVLALVASGDFMANTPIDLLLEGTDVTLWMLYVDETATALADVPEHDVAFLAVGESEPNMPVLARMPELLANWPGPVVNQAPQSIAGLTRDDVCQRLAGEPSLYSPLTVRISRERLRALVRGEAALADILPDAVFPLIVRPVGTHAGKGLEKVTDLADLATYLAEHGEAVFYLAPFVDYSGPDGLFRKQRIAFIDGRAYPGHFAASEHWMVHYLSARMTELPERRAEEEAWMRDFDTDFAVRHGDAFAALHQRFGLDYFGIDCAEARDGRLLLFEADVAMIVHDLDPAATFPYKKPAMRKLFTAFVTALTDRAS